MSTSRIRTYPVENKLITYQQFFEAGVDYYRGLNFDLAKLLFPEAVIFTSNAWTYSTLLTSPGAGLLTGAEVRGADGLGHFLHFAGVSGLPVPADAGVKYCVGLKFCEPLAGDDGDGGTYTGEINPRTLAMEHRYLMDHVGEVDSPTSMSVVGGSLRVIVDSLFGETGVDHSGRTVRIWKNNPASIVEGQVYQDCIVVYTGGNNLILVPGSLGQGNPSLDPSEYTCWLQGPSVFRAAFKDLADRASNPGYIYLGSYNGGVAAAVTPNTDETLFFSKIDRLEQSTPARTEETDYPDIVTKANGRLTLTEIAGGVRITGGDKVEIQGRQFAIGQTDVTTDVPGAYYLRCRMDSNDQLEFYLDTGARSDAAGAGGGDSTFSDVLIGSFVRPSGSPGTATDVIAYANKARLGARITFKPDTDLALDGTGGAQKGNSTVSHFSKILWARKPTAINLSQADVHAIDPDTQLRTRVANPESISGDDVTTKTQVVCNEYNAPCRHWITAVVEAGGGIGEISGRCLQVDASTEATYCMIEGVGLGAGVTMDGVTEYDMGAVTDPNDVYVSSATLLTKYTVTIADAQMSVSGLPAGSVTFTITTDKTDADHVVSFWAMRRKSKQKVTANISVASSPPTGTLEVPWVADNLGELLIAEESTVRTAGASSPYYGPFKDKSHKFMSVT